MSHSHTHSHAYTATVEKKPHSRALITVEVPLETVSSHRALAIESIQKNATMDGFRKGRVPEKIIVDKFGEMAILEEATEITIRHLYPHIIEEHKLEAIGAPKVTITKLAPGNPLHFTLEVSLVPEVLLPDYRALAKNVNAEKINIDITDKEVDETIARVQRRKLAYDRLQHKAAAKADADEQGLTLPTPETSVESLETEEDFAKLPLPPLTDEYVKTLGGFDSVDAFKADVRKHMSTEKEQDAASKRRAALTDAIVDGATIDLPSVLVESEISQMFAEMESDITRAGLNMDDYLLHVKKTRDDLEKEWTPVAEKRAKLQLVLNAIAKKDAIVPDETKVATEMSNLLARFTDADHVRTRIYVETVLTNEAVMEMLEKIT
jgi:trigger factor